MSGEIVPFYEVCPDVGLEMRQITVRNHPRLPNGVYDLVDSYCGDPNCDCRVAYLFITRDTQPTAALASMTFGWEPLDFYVKWMGVNDEITHDLKGACFDANGASKRASSSIFGIGYPEIRRAGIC